MRGAKVNENIIKIITTESLSVDFFRGERKIALFTDGDYKELKQISGEYGVKRYSLSDEVTHTNSSLIVGFGGSEILERAKEIAIREGGNLLLIPTFPTFCDFAPYRVTKSLSVEHEMEGHTVLLVKELLNNQPREKLALILSSISAVLMTLLDKAFECFVNEEDSSALSLLALIKDSLKKCSAYSCPTPTIGFDLACLLGELCSNLSFESLYLPLASAYIFSLYKKGKMSYNDYMFGISFAIYSVIDSFKVQPELLLPPNRREIRAELKKLVPDFNEFVSLEPETFVLRNFILKDRYAEIKSAIADFPALAKSYLRLSGNSGFAIRKLFTAEDLLKALPLSAEAVGGTSILKHIYSTGIMQ